MTHLTSFLYALSAVLVVTALPCSNSVAQEANAPNVASHNFRVLISVFNANDMVDQHLVVFDKSMVYDFAQGNDKSVTVFDLQRNRVILLDRDTQVRSTINTEDLTKLIAQIRASADEKSQESLGMNAKAELADGKYIVQFGKIQYTAATQNPTTDAIALAFGKFADWASRLNAARQRGLLPPFARMELNQKVAKAGELPREIELEVKRGLKTERFRSTHELIEQVSEQDRKQISEVGSMLTLYREVPLKAFP